jgi:hypothetical protein
MKARKLSYLGIVVFVVISVPLLIAATPVDFIVTALPPRPTVAPVSGNTPGASIQLQIEGVTVGTEGVWTAIQWVDGFGDWHTVDGWQGTVELDGTQTWWVAPEDLDTGPFRWQVFDEQGGMLLATSDSFNLPERERTRMVVPIDVE